MKRICFFILPILMYSCSGSSPKKELKETTIPEQKPEPIENNKEDKTGLTIHQSKFRIPPIDQSSEDQSLQLFVSKLRKIVRQKNLDELIACLDTGIVSSHGGGEYGIPTFKTRWGLNENHQESKIWEFMDKYISMGGAWDNDKKTVFCFPYVQSNLIHGRLKHDLDCYFMVTCIDPQVVIYQKASTLSKKIGLLSYEIVNATNISGEFTKIETVDGSISGYMLTKQLFRCYTDHPVLEKIDGEWKITSFAPYD